MKTFEAIETDIVKKLEAFDLLNDSYKSQEGKEAYRVYRVIGFCITFSENVDELKSLINEKIQEASEGRQVCGTYHLNQAEISLLKRYVTYNFKKEKGL